MDRGHPRPRLPGADARAAARRRGRRRREPGPVRPADRPSRCAPSRAVLYVHGWSDYFFQTRPRRVLARPGAAFYALDLRKYGRSLRPGQTPGYVDDLRDLRRGDRRVARRRRARSSARAPASCSWATRPAGWSRPVGAPPPRGAQRAGAQQPVARAAGLVARCRHISGAGDRRLARFQPEGAAAQHRPRLLRAHPERRERRGVDRTTRSWRPTPSFPVRAGWLQAVMAGHAAGGPRPGHRGADAHARVEPDRSSARGGARTCGTRTWCSTSSALARRAVQLGRCVTVVRDPRRAARPDAVAPAGARAVLRGDRPLVVPRTAGADAAPTGAGCPWPRRASVRPRPGATRASRRRVLRGHRGRARPRRGPARSLPVGSSIRPSVRSIASSR